jgi:hypothetical protein
MKSGTFTSVWDGDTIITTPATLNEKTGEVTVLNTVEDGIEDLNSLDREYFTPDNDEENIEVCTTCHSHILKPVMVEGIGKMLKEEQECSNPDCESRV